MGRLWISLCLLALFLVSPPAVAQLLPLSLAEGLDLGPSPRQPVLASGAGDHWLLAFSNSEGPDAGRVRAVLFNRSGTPIAANHLVSNSLHLGLPTVAAAGDGWLVAWAVLSDSGPKILLRRLQSDGSPVSAEIPVTLAPTEPDGNSPTEPAITCNSGGACVLAWKSGIGAVTARRITAAGELLGEEILVRGPLPNEETPPGFTAAINVRLAEDGRFAVFWIEAHLRGVIPPNTEIKPWARIFRADGVPLTDPWQLGEPEGDGLFLVSRVDGAWNDQNQLLAAWDFVGTSYEGTSGRALYSQLFDTVGAPVGERRELDPGGAPVAGALDWCASERRFVVSWQRLASFGPAGERYQPWVQLVSPEGEPEGLPTAVPREPKANLFLGSPQLACGESGDVRVLWTESEPPASEKLSTTTLRPGQPVCTTPFVENPPEAVPCVSLGPDGRYLAYAAFRGAEGNSRPAGPIQVTRDAASFFFNNMANPEIYAKVVDGRVLNDHFWLFYGALSNQEYLLAVYDRATGLSRTYYNPAQTLASRGDTNAFPEAPAEASVVLEPLELEEELFGRTETGGCLGLAKSLCLTDEAFTVTMDWVDFQGNPGQARAVQQTNLSGYFTFVNPNNVELAVKILDGREITGKWWVFYASLTNVEFTLTIRGSNGQIVKQYQNPRRSFGSLADTTAF